MHFFTKTSVALTVALAAFSDATSHGRHRYRHFNRQVGSSGVSVPLSTGYPAPTGTAPAPPAQKPADTSSAGITSIVVPTGTGSSPKPSEYPSVVEITSTVTYTLGTGPSASVTTYTFKTTAPLAIETQTVIPVSLKPRRQTKIYIC